MVRNTLFVKSHCKKQIFLRVSDKNRSALVSITLCATLSYDYGTPRHPKTNWLIETITIYHVGQTFRCVLVDSRFLDTKMKHRYCNDKRIFFARLFSSFVTFSIEITYRPPCILVSTTFDDFFLAPIIYLMTLFVVL